MRALFLCFALLFAANASWAQVPGSAKVSSPNSPERGWYWFETEPKPTPLPEQQPEPPPPPPKPALPQEPPEPPEARCKKADTWSAECGFVDPGTDFAFQSKQRDALMERMAVSPNDPKAVENFQYYMRWVIGRAAEVTNIWRYNMAQNPELDPSVNAPVSAFGLRLMTDVRKGQASEIYELIRNEGGFLVYFSRHDCTFCHQMSDTFKRLSKETGLPVRNAALDNTCMPGFEEGCMVAPQTTAPAQALQVATVPALFLYVKPNTWIRIATGVVDLQTMKLRTEQFFQAYRNAMLRGIDNGNGARAPVDFSDTDAKGSTSTGIEGGKNPQLPSEADIKRMLGAN